ncbi:MAG: ACP S-malonyltransferase [Burkholderiaceae bacterium]
MLDAFAASPAVQATLVEASEALGVDLGALIAHGPKDALDLTTNTQPIMLTAGVAIFRAWLAAGGPAPALVAGHSLGEYSALVAAGALTFREAVPLVHFRAEAMQQAVPVGQGAMAAVLGLADADVRALCVEAEEGQVVEAVNYNAPQQVVIAGHKQAVDRACEIAKRRGAKRALLLPVSAPFHSTLLHPASVQLRGYLAGVPFAVPRVAVINNVDVAVVSDAPGIKDALVRQAASPVRWVETIQSMKARAVTHIVECGPGKVLAGLTRRIDPSMSSEAMFDPASIDKILEMLK